MADPRAFTVPLPTMGGKQWWADEFVHRRYRIQRNVMTGHHRLLDPRNLRLAVGSLDNCLAVFDSLEDTTRRRDHVVVLLHGIFRAKEVWNPMARALEAAGYDPEPVNYPSTLATIEDHAEQIERLLSRLRDVRTVSFVCHSMGGLVAREVLARGASWRQRLRVNRLVMIATPNRGAEMADRLVPLGWAWRTIAGPSGLQLTTEYVAELGLPDVPFGIIAGARGDGIGFNPLLPGDNDATVTLESTHLPGAEDTYVLPALHTFIMQDQRVIEATVRYLATGRFQPA